MLHIFNLIGLLKLIQIIKNQIILQKSPRFSYVFDRHVLKNIYIFMLNKKNKEETFSVMKTPFDTHSPSTSPEYCILKVFLLLTKSAIV